MPDQRAPLSPGSAPVPAAQTPGGSSLLLLATSVVAIAGLYFGRSVLIPITLAVLLSFLLAPLVEVFRRIRIPNLPAALLAVIIALGLVLAVGGLIGAQIADLASEVPHYAATIEDKVEAVQGFVASKFDTVLHGIGQQLHLIGAHAATGNAAPAQTPGNAGPKPIPVEVHSPPTSAVQLAGQVLEPLVNPLAALAIIFVLSTFILAQREDLRDRIIRLFGAADLHRTTIAMDETASRLSRYFLAQLAINVTFGIVIGAALYFIGLPTPMLWGIIAMLLRFLPYIGSPLAALLPTLLAAATSPGWAQVIETIALFAVLESITGQIIEPLVYGRSTGMSPFAVVVSAIFWTWIWGPIGLILSTPLTLCFMVLGRHVERLEFLDILLGDRAPLRPEESFYQRLLAGDPDDAREQAEEFLKDGSLGQYFDEVAIPGLQHAALDARRGALAGEELNRVLQSLHTLSEDLMEEAEQWQAPGTKRLPEFEAVLCIAGRGPLDEAAAGMLAQLLAERGIASRTISGRGGARSELASVPARNTAAVCVCSLDVEGSVSHLRYLLRRLRRALPDRPVVLALWPAEAAAAQDERLRAAIGADVYTASLREAVTACAGLVPQRALTQEPHAA